MRMCFAACCIFLTSTFAKGFDKIGLATYAVETYSNDSLLSVGSLEFHIKAKQIRLLSFSDAMFKPNVQTIMQVFQITSIDYSNDKLMLLSGASEFGFNFVCRIKLTSGCIIIPEFEIDVNAPQKLRIVPLSPRGNMFKDKYIPKVVLGIVDVQKNKVK